MSNESVTIHGHRYVSDSALSFGDYGGAGSVGLANINALKDRVDGQYGYDDFYRAADDESRAYESDETANIRRIVAESPPRAFYLTGDYGSETIFLLASDADNVETLAELADYPSLDDDGSSEIEMQWEVDAWESWIRADLERILWPGGTSAAYDALADDVKFAAYCAAMETCNEYSEPEYNGVHVNVERIAEAYRAKIEKALSANR